MGCRLRRTSIEGPVQLSLKAGGIGFDRSRFKLLYSDALANTVRLSNIPRGLPDHSQHPPHSNTAAPVGEIEDSSLLSKNPHFERLVTSLGTSIIVAQLSPLSASSMGTQRSVQTPVPSFSEPLLSIGSPSLRCVQCLPFDRVLTADVQLAILRSLHLVIHPLSPPHISGGSLKAVTRNKRTHPFNVRSLSSPW